MDSMAIPASLRSALREYALHADPIALIHFTKQLHNSGQTQVCISLLLSKLLDTADPDCRTILAHHYSQGTGVVQDAQKAKQLLKSADQQGSANAQRELAHIYYDEGKYLQAIEYFSICSENTNHFSPEDLGKIFRFLGSSYHKLADPDYQEATQYYTEAAEKYGDTESYRHMATVCIEDVKNRDIPKAIRYYEIAAQQGDLYSIQQLGWLYTNGLDNLVEQDLDKAAAYLLPYSNCDHLDIIISIGELYMRKRDWEHAAEFLQRAWDMGQNAALASNLGFSYYKLSDLDTAKKYLEYAYDQGDYFYADCLALIYELQDQPKQAMRCYEKAHKNAPLSFSMLSSYINLLIENYQYEKAFRLADEGEKKYNDVEFMYQKANLVLTGKVCFISEDEAAEMMEEVLQYDSYADQARRVLGRYYSKSLQHYQAIKHLTESFENGDIEAAFLIGRVYESGKGSVCADAEKAYHWYSVGASAGDSAAQKEVACFRRTLFGKHKRFKTV